MTFWWLSFATDDGPRGVAIVAGEDIDQAVRRSHELGINPGGEVAGVPFPDDPDATAERERWGVDRLISNDDLRSAGYQKRGELIDEYAGQLSDEGETVEEYLDRQTHLVCDDDNTTKVIQ